MTCADLDDEGYPMQALLDRIEHWPWQEFEALVALLPTVWRYAEIGYYEIGTITEKEGCERKRLHLSTGGWSGNESILRALQRNSLFWMTSFEEHRRGGHYIFDLSRFPKA